jgi:hypothetical protein
MKALIIAGKMHIVSIGVLGALSWQKVRVYQYLQQPAGTMVEFKLRPEECGTCVLAARFGIMQTVDTAQPRIEYVTQRQKAHSTEPTAASFKRCPPQARGERTALCVNSMDDAARRF